MALTPRQIFIGQLFLFFLFSYILPLQVHRYDLPIEGKSDFYNYVRSYLAPFDMRVGDAPFIFRKFNHVLVHAVYRLGFFINYNIEFKAAEEVRRVYFAALTVNWLGLFVLAGFVMDIVNRLTKNAAPLLGLIAGLILLQSYGMIYVISGLIDAWTWTFFAAMYWCMLTRREALFYVFLVLSVTQREITPLVIAAWAAVDLWRARHDPPVRRRILWRILVAVALFGAYLVVRAVIFPDLDGARNGYVNQLSATAWIDNLLHPGIGLSFVVMTLLQLNCFVIFAVLYLAVRRSGGAAGMTPEVRRGTVNLCACLLLLGGLAIGADVWLNMARLMLFVSPVPAAYSALLLGDLLRQRQPAVP